jgi:hypothetical protein
MKSVEAAGINLSRKEARRFMAKGKRRKRRIATDPSKKKRSGLREVPIDQIEHTADIIDKVIQNVGKLSRAERTRLSVILAHAALGLRV